MCLDNIKIKWQPFGKCKFAYKVFGTTTTGKLVTDIANMPVKTDTSIWQKAYKRMPEYVKSRVSVGGFRKVHDKKISVFLTLKDARKWSNTRNRIWIIEIKYDKLLVGKQNRSLKGALVDEFRLVKQVT